MAVAAATPTVGLDPTDTGLGSANARAVYRDLLRFGPRSRSELTTRLGLSAPTVTRTTRDLLDAGWLHTLRSEEHTSELQSRGHLVCRLLLEKKKYKVRPT